MTKLGKNLEITEIQPMDVCRRAVAHKTTEGWKNAPHASGTFEPDVTEFLAAFAQFKEYLKRECPDAPKISINSVLLHVIAECLKAAPHLNAILEYSDTTKTGALKISKNINMAIPLMAKNDENRDVPRTVTMVVPKVEEKNLFEVAAYVNDLIRRAEKTNWEELMFQVARDETLYDLKHGKLSVLPRGLYGLMGKNKVKCLKGKAKEEYYAIPETDRIVPKDIMDASVLVSNVGAAFPEWRGHMTMIDIIPPMVFFLGLGAVQRQPGVYLDSEGNEQIGIRSVMPFLFVMDHRAFDGAHVIPFIKQLNSIFKHPQQYFDQVLATFSQDKVADQSMVSSKLDSISPNSDQVRVF
jgi:pyruvate dehydrogenase E2 component (dihydrolipoamide acetyltransferase)